MRSKHRISSLCSGGVLRASWEGSAQMVYVVRRKTRSLSPFLSNPLHDGQHSPRNSGIFRNLERAHPLWRPRWIILVRRAVSALLQAICVTFDHVFSCLFHHRNRGAQILLQRHYENWPPDPCASLPMHFCVPCLPVRWQRPSSNFSDRDAMWDQQRVPECQRFNFGQGCDRNHPSC